MLLARPGFVEDKIAKGKPWEENIASLCCFFMRDNALYVDVGANIGYHSLRVAALFSGATCVCFEPHPLLYTQLLQNLAVNSTIQNLRAHNLAVGERSGDVEFYLQRPESYNRGLSSIMPNADLAGAYEKRRVKIVALDDFFADDTKSQIAVMKIDVQGYEAQVIVGARETIQCSRPVIIFEFEANYHGQQAVTVFESILQQLVNYSVFLVKSRAAEFYRSFAVADVCQAGFEGNFLCLPQEVYRF
jgi:FkbM family methyltransferase